MSIQTVEVAIDNINDERGLDSVVKALKNIDGVTAIEIHPSKDVGLVRYDDTKTSIYAFKAAINTVDYVTQAFPDDAPQNPDND